MASNTFVNKTLPVVDAEWLNEVDYLVHDIFQTIDGTGVTGDTVQVTATGSSTARTLASLLGTGGDLTYQVPTDFSTLQNAINELSTFVIREGHRIILNIETAHSPSTGVLVENGDYSHFKITSSDASVVLAAGFPVGTHVIHGVNARMPELACLIDANGIATGNGYFAEDCSTGIVAAGAGVKNIASPASGNTAGLRVDLSSSVMAENTVFTNNNRNAWSSSSIMNVSLADLSDAKAEGLFASRSSIVHATRAIIEDATLEAIRAHSSIVTARGVDLDRAGSHGVIALRGSTVDIITDAAVPTNTTIASAGGSGIHAEGGSSVTADGNLTITSPALDGITARSGATVDAVACTISLAGARGVKSVEGATVDVRNASITGSVNEDLRVEHGGIIVATGVTTSTSGPPPDVADINIRLFNSDSRAGSGTISVDAWVAANRGSSSIASGTTSIAITHGLSYTPALNDIRITPSNNPTNDIGLFWVSGITSTQFTVNVRADPGATGWSFWWAVNPVN